MKEIVERLPRNRDWGKLYGVFKVELLVSQDPLSFDALRDMNNESSSGTQEEIEQLLEDAVAAEAKDL